MSQLPLPDFFSPESAADWAHQPDLGVLRAEAARWRRRHRIPFAAADRRRVHLLLIDLQRDFCLPEGALFVAGRDGRGAIDDSERLARFVYRNLTLLTDITCTLDTHTPQQVFSPDFWTDADGRPLGPDRELTAEEVGAGAVRPAPGIAAMLGVDDGWLHRELVHYCGSLEAEGRYRLHLWPQHCLLGGDGHSLVGVVQEARIFHALVRRSPVRSVLKGDHPLTENYSVFAPEVRERHAPAPAGSRAARPVRIENELIEELLAADRVVVAGQATSHCVMWSVDDLLAESDRRTGDLANRIYVLEDCMSPVVVRDPGSSEILFDFSDQARAAAARWRERGVHLVRSTVDPDDWP